MSFLSACFCCILFFYYRSYLLSEINWCNNTVSWLVRCRQTKLDEALLSSGRVSDALQALMEWLGKAESYLTEDQPTLGDLDTVTMLLEQHKVRDTFHISLPARSVVDALEFTHTWQVNALCRLSTLTIKQNCTFYSAFSYEPVFIFSGIAIFTNASFFSKVKNIEKNE